MPSVDRPTITRAHADVTVLDLGGTENRFTPEWLTAVDGLLDEVVGEGPTALVTTASGRHFSLGLDLDWLGANLDQYEPYLSSVHGLLARFLTLPIPTIAALPGHAFGMGAVLALAHDDRVMRRDRGYFCFPEIDLGLTFSPGMLALIRATLPARTSLEAITTGRRYGGEDALAAGIVDAVADLADLVGLASSRVAPLVGKDSSTLAAIKQAVYAEVVASLRGDTDSPH